MAVHIPEAKLSQWLQVLLPTILRSPVESQNNIRTEYYQ